MRWGWLDRDARRLSPRWWAFIAIVMAVNALMRLISIATSGGDWWDWGGLVAFGFAATFNGGLWWRARLLNGLDYDGSDAM